MLLNHDFWKYFTIFFSTLLDHTGVPVPLIAAIVIMRNQKIEIFVSLLTVICALILSDLVTFYFGRYFYKVALKSKSSYLMNVSSPRVFQKIFEKASSIALRPGIWIVIFNKFIPLIGKYMPLAIGYSNEGSFCNYMALFVIADAFYAGFYVLSSYYFGEAIKNGQVWLSMTFAGLFLAIYFITYIFSKKAKREKNTIK